MAMRAAVRSPKRALKSFAEIAIGLLMAYAPIAAILVFTVSVPLGGVLIFGVIGVPAMAALLTVLTIGLGGDGSHPGGLRPYDYDPGSDPTLRSGGGYGASGGGADSGGGGGDGDGGL